MLEGRDVGLRVDRAGLRLPALRRRACAAWEPVVDDTLLRERELPEGLNASLRLEAPRGRSSKPRTAPTEDEPAQPQVLVLASGDLVPFEILLRRDGTEEIRRIAGTIEGKFEVHDDTPRRP